HQERWRADRAATAGYRSVHESICWSATESFRSKSLLRPALCTKNAGELIALLPLDVVLCTSAFAGVPQNPSGASHFCGQQLNCALHQERWRADRAATARDCALHEVISWSATESFRSKSLLRPAAELRFAPRTLAS